jgi:uncharacterized protein (DUF3084 family)
MEKPKVESFVKYDDRRKELTHEVKETRPAKMEGEDIGEVSMRSVGVYNEEGVKKIVKDLSKRRTKLEQEISQLKDSIKAVPEMTKELEELKAKSIELQKIDQAEKTETQIKDKAEELTKVKKDLEDIKGAVGSRLKL